jgi:hypothetical protein
MRTQELSQTQAGVVPHEERVQSRALSECSQSVQASGSPVCEFVVSIREQTPDLCAKVSNAARTLVSAEGTKRKTNI